MMGCQPARSAAKNEERSFAINNLRELHADIQPTLCLRRQEKKGNRLTDSICLNKRKVSRLN
jgi:hypothetical protein